LQAIDQFGHPTGPAKQLRQFTKNGAPLGISPTADCLQQPEVKLPQPGKTGSWRVGKIMHNEKSADTQHPFCISHPFSHLGIFGQIGGRNAIEACIQGDVLGPANDKCHIFQMSPEGFFAGNRKIFFSQFDTDHSAGRKLLRDSESEDAGAASLIKNAPRGCRNFVDNLFFHQRSTPKVPRWTIKS